MQRRNNKWNKKDVLSCPSHFLDTHVMSFWRRYVQKHMFVHRSFTYKSVMSLSLTQLDDKKRREKDCTELDKETWVCNSWLQAISLLFSNIITFFLVHSEGPLLLSFSSYSFSSQTICLFLLMMISFIFSQKIEREKDPFLQSCCPILFEHQGRKSISIEIKRWGGWFSTGYLDKNRFHVTLEDLSKRKRRRWSAAGFLPVFLCLTRKLDDQNRFSRSLSLLASSWMDSFTSHYYWVWCTSFFPFVLSTTFPRFLVSFSRSLDHHTISLFLNSFLYDIMSIFARFRRNISLLLTLVTFFVDLSFNFTLFLSKN